jgi:hypothetical protein
VGSETFSFYNLGVMAATLSCLFVIFHLALLPLCKLHFEKFLIEPQCGFRGGKSCIDAVASLKIIIEKRIEFSVETRSLFLDL